eukprot:960416_1
MAKKMYGKSGKIVGSMGGMAKKGGNISPMFNVNMGYMMGRAVKKCQPLKNGLEICAMYNPMLNQLNVDVKCKNCKKLKKGRKKRLFPKKLSKMIKMLVKQRVFGTAGDNLLGGTLQQRFARGVGLKMKKKRGKGKGKGKGRGRGKGAKRPPPMGPPHGQGPPPQMGPPQMGPPPGSNGGPVGSNAMGNTGMNMGGMNAMENGPPPGRRRMINEYDNDLVQFDTMEGNIGYSMWRAE